MRHYTLNNYNFAVCGVSGGCTSTAGEGILLEHGDRVWLYPAATADEVRIYMAATRLLVAVYAEPAMQDEQHPDRPCCPLICHGACSNCRDAGTRAC